MDEQIKHEHFKREYYEHIWGRKNPISLGKHANQILYLDQDRFNAYRHNSLGHRSDEFHMGVDILFGGCSYTYGMGVPEKYIWANMVADTLNSTRDIIASPGTSIAWIVDRFFEYFRVYGNPKKLFCLFPDLYRLELPTDGKTLYQLHKPDGSPSDPRLARVDSRWAEKTYKNLKILKKPINIEEIATKDVALYLNIRAIRHLEMYCKSSNIDLKWTSWDRGSRSDIEKATLNPNLAFDKYFSFDSDFEPVCHGAMRTPETDVFFDWGTDVHGTSPGHPGMHAHMHFAEAFLARM